MAKKIKKTKKANIKKKEETPVEEVETESVAENEEHEASDIEEGEELEGDNDDSVYEFNEEQEDEEEPLNEDEKEKTLKKTAVLYFSSIPPKFNPVRFKEYFEKIAPGMIGRVFLAKNKKSTSYETRFLEGWLEIKRKKLAKRIADSINATPVGGKKRDYVSSVLWNVKYLSGFKWYHLVEQLNYEKAIGDKRMQVEVQQARRIAAAFEEQVEKGERLRKLEEKVLKQGGKWEKFKRQVSQKKNIKSVKQKFKKEKPKADDEEVMKMIFG